MRTNKIGRWTLGDEPRVAGTVSRRETLSASGNDLAARCDIVEVRLDKLGLDTPGWLGHCERIEAEGTPVVVTLRSSAEGGAWDGPPEERQNILLPVLESVSAVDVELALGGFSRLCVHAQALGKTLILSRHDFDQTPSLEALVQTVRQVRACAAAVPKIATMIRKEDDISVLGRLLADEQGAGPICVIGMGELGSRSRLAFPAAGSCLAYGYLDAPVAPGQLSAEALRQALRNG